MLWLQGPPGPVGTTERPVPHKEVGLLPLGRMLARVCQEAGAWVRFNAFLRDMNVNVAATTKDALKWTCRVLGAPSLAVDITLRCVLSSAGEPHPNTADVDGAALYPELTTSGRCRLVIAIEIGGRWSTEAVDFVRQLSFAKATALADAGRGCCRLFALCLLLPLWWNPLTRAIHGVGRVGSHLWADLLEQDPR